MPAAVVDHAKLRTLVRSEFYQEISLGGDEWFVYNSLLNKPRVVDSAIRVLLAFFSQPRTQDDCLGTFSGDIGDVLEDLERANLLVSPEFDERRSIIERQAFFIQDALKGKRLNRLEIAISNACNLRCPHCMHFNNNDIPAASASVNINHTSIVLGIENFLAALPADFDDEIRVHFGNGEPLINWSAIDFAVQYCEGKSGYRFRYAMNSNLTLMTSEIAAYVAHHKFKVSTSLDGIKEVNDRQRINRSGKGSFDQTVRGMKYLKDAGHPVDGFTATITDNNFHKTDERLVDLAVELGVTEIAMDFDLVNNTLYDAEECADLVFGLRKYAKSKGVSLYGNWETPFKMLVSESWTNNAYAYCPAMDGSTLEFGVNGDIKTCGHTNSVVARNFDAKSALAEGSRYHHLLQERLPNNMELCRGCEIEGACGGQCHVTQEATSENKEVLLKACQVMKDMTRRLVIEQYGSS